MTKYKKRSSILGLKWLTQHKKIPELCQIVTYDSKIKLKVIKQ